MTKKQDSIADRLTRSRNPQAIALSYERKVMQKDGSKITEVVEDYAVTRWKRDHGESAALPASFVTAPKCSRPHAGCSATLDRQQHLQDSERARGHQL